MKRNRVVEEKNLFFDGNPITTLSSGGCDASLKRKMISPRGGRGNRRGSLPS
jgi:hypothetical protein